MTVEEMAEHWPLAALLRGGRRTLGAVVRTRLETDGYDDLPANGPYVLAAVAGTEVPLSAVVRQLGLSKQAGGQLVDILVARGYLERSVDPADRRRLVVSLTARGRGASSTVRAAAADLEARLQAEVGTQAMAAARLTLAALTSLGDPRA